MIKKFLKYAFLPALLLFIFPSALSAEETENDARYVARELEAKKQAAAAANAASAKKSFEQAGRIAFEQVLNQPDNVELNFQFARQQAQSGDVLGASGTLERILMTHPELHEVRLFYAIVLFRLDNLIDAESELKKLEKAPLPGSLKSQVGLYRNEIKKRKKKTKFAIVQSNGFEFDDNRNASPSDKRALFSNAPVSTVPGSTSRRHDTSFLNITSIDMSHDLGTQAGHKLIGGFTYFQQEQTQVDNLDLSSFQYNLGAELKTKYANITPAYNGSQVFLSREHFLRTQGGTLDFTRAVTPKLDVNSGFSFQHQDYLPISENQTSRDRTGWEETFNMGTGYSLPWNMRVGMGLLYSHKSARTKHDTYNRYGFGPSHTWLLGRGQFLINTIDVNFDRYKGFNPQISRRHRNDTTFRYRLTYGVPISTLFLGFGKYLPGVIKDINATATYEFYRSLSNLSNYTYSNHKVQAMLTKRWEF